MKRGPKGKVDESPLPWKPRSKGSAQLRLFAEKYLIVPRGKGARSPMKLRDWQVSMAGTLLDDSQVNMAVWVIPRGNGKSGLAAAIALHHIFFSGIEGARCIIVAQDERSAGRLLATASRMVQLNEELAARSIVYRDRIEIPGTDSALLALPGEAHRIEGEDATLVIVDEIGFVRKDAWEAAVLSSGKREGSKILGIGTPSPVKWRDISPLYDLVIRGRSEPDAENFRLVEYGADPKLPIDSPATWEAANPAYGDWLTEQAIRAQLPPVTREQEFRRARLGQWTETASEPAFNAEQWRACERKGTRIPDGARVVVALDGSMNGDSTALVVGSISSKPHFQVGGLWEPANQAPDYEVPVLEVEDRIRELAERYRVVEVVADPFRWQRTLQQLDEDGLPVTQFPQTPRRLTPATVDLRTAVAHGLLTHAGESELNRHVLRTSVEETSRGVKLGKPSKSERIDLSACLVMAYSRCAWLGGKKQRQARKVKGFRK